MSEAGTSRFRAGHSESEDDASDVAWAMPRLDEVRDRNQRRAAGRRAGWAGRGRPYDLSREVTK